MNEYTDLEFWKKYWDNYEVVPKETVFFDEIIKDFPDNAKLIEVGGFPGMFAAYFKKVKNYGVTILDFYIDPLIIKKIEEVNNLKAGSISYILADFLKMDLIEEYDIVCSFGFIEHFENTKDIIEKHFMLLKKGGLLFITLPNFRGLNGWIQKIVHPENYLKHNINSMNINYLKFVIKEFTLGDCQIDFIGDPCLWIEKDAKTNKFVRFIVSKLGRVLSMIPFKRNYLLAPYIYIKAIKL